MYTKRNQRRQFLKLASGLLVAPLGSMNYFANAQTASASPLRLVTIIDHYGLPVPTRQETWISSQTGDYALQSANLGTVLQPLAAYMDKMLVLSNMSNQSMIETRTPGSHHGYIGHILSASEPLDEREASAKIPHESIDVLIGNYLHGSASGAGRAHAHAFFTEYSALSDPTYCYNPDGTLKRSIAGASNAVTRLFGTAAATQEVGIDSRMLARSSVLESVSSRVQALKGGLNNAGSQEKLEAYEESVNSLAAELEAQQTQGAQTCQVPDNFDSLSSGGRNIPESERGDILKVIGQLMSCNMISSATYAFGGELHNQHNHPFLDSGGDSEVAGLLAQNMHVPSHRADDTANKVHELIRIHQSELIAELLDTLANTTDIDGSPMIDNTVVYLPTCMAHNTHGGSNYPIAMIAGANTNLIGGYHYDVGNISNNDMLVTLAQGLNVPITSFGGYEDTGVRVASLNTGPIGKMLKATLG